MRHTILASEVLRNACLKKRRDEKASHGQIENMMRLVSPINKLFLANYRAGRDADAGFLITQVYHRIGPHSNIVSLLQAWSRPVGFSDQQGITRQNGIKIRGGTHSGEE